MTSGCLGSGLFAVLRSVRPEVDPPPQKNTNFAHHPTHWQRDPPPLWHALTPDVDAVHENAHESPCGAILLRVSFGDQTTRLPRPLPAPPLPRRDSGGLVPHSGVGSDDREPWQLRVVVLKVCIDGVGVVAPVLHLVVLSVRYMKWQMAMSSNPLPNHTHTHTHMSHATRTCARAGH